MLCGNAGGKAIGSSECDIAGLDPSGHVVGFGGGIDDLINGLHSEVEGHEFTLYSYCQNMRLNYGGS